MSCDAKLGELLILVVMENNCRLTRFRTYVNRATFLDDAKMDYRCVLGDSGQRIAVQCSKAMWITTVRMA